MLIPLITGVNPVHGPFHLHRGLGFVLINRDDLEGGGRTFSHHIVKQRLDADHRTVRGKTLGDAALNGTARTFGNTHGKACLQRLGGLFDMRKFDRDTNNARIIGAQVVRQGFHRRIKPFIIAAKAVAGIGFQTVAGPHHDFAFNRQIGPRCTKQIAHIGGQHGAFGQAQRRVGQGQVEINAFGQEILDQHSGACQRGGVHIGEQLQPPSATRHAGAGGQVKDVTTSAFIRGSRNLTAVFHPVRAGQDGG